MMLHSFRFKLGVLGFVLAGALLLAFAGYAVSVLERVSRERVRYELRALLDAQMRKAQPEDHWRRFDDSLRAMYGGDESRRFQVRVAQAASGEMLYVSPGFDLPVAQLPAPVPPRPAELSSPEEPPRQLLPRPEEEGREARRPPRPEEEGREVRRPPPQRRMQVAEPLYATVRTPPGEWLALTMANEEVSVTVAMSLAGARAEVRRFRQALLVVAPLGLLLLAGAGWLFGHLALRPVNLIARTAASVTAHQLSARVPAARMDTEFRHLIEVINGMLERLERGFQQATRFSADAAHELKTPLAILQAQLERSLQRTPDNAPEQREYAEQLEEVQRLKSILRKLLLLSQADAGRLPLHREPLDLAALARAAIENIALLAPGRTAILDAPEALVLDGDADLLGQVLDNLVSNAIKFGEASGPITIEVAALPGRAELRVSNTGHPVLEGDRAQIFDRFYRADKAHSRRIEGAGLGLSLAREIARAHGGDLVLTRSDARRTTFALTLPCAGRAATA